MNQSTQALQQAAILWQQGRHDAAIQAFEQVLRDEPHNFLALNNLAAIYAKRQQFTAAEQLYLRACKYHPKRNEPFLALATIYGQHHRPQDAIRQLEHALKNKPNDHLVLFLLGKHCHQLRRYDEAIGYLKKSLAIKVESQDQVLLLARALADANHMEEACALYEQLLAQEPDNINAIKALAECRFIKGDKAGAIDVYEQALRFYPDEMAIYYSLSYMTDKHLDKALEQKVDALLAQENGALSQKSYAQFLKAKFAKRSQHYEQEMAWLVKAHKTFKQSHPVPVSTKAYMAVFESYAQSPPFGMCESLESSNRSERPIFIIGTPRSGSTLLENIVCAADPAIAKGEETSVISRQLFRLQDLPLATRNSERLQNMILSEYQDMGLLNTPRFTDKSLENCFCVDVILSVFPAAKIIYSKRRLLASMVSILQNNLPALPWAHSVDEITRYFEACDQAMRHWQSRYPDRILVVNYESLAAQPEPHAREILAFCDIPWSDACLDFHKNEKVLSKTASTDQIRSPINTQAIDRFKNYATFFEQHGLSFSD